MPCLRCPTGSMRCPPGAIAQVGAETASRQCVGTDTGVARTGHRQGDRRLSPSESAARGDVVLLITPHDSGAEKTAAPQQEPGQVPQRIQPAVLHTLAIAKGAPADDQALPDTIGCGPARERDG